MSATPAFDVAVVGATGAVGQQMVDILAQRNFPVRTLYPLASKNSVGKNVSFHDKEIPVQDLADFDFAKAQIALFSAGGTISAKFAPKAAATGCVVVDNSSHFRGDDDIPLVIAEVNPQRVADYTHRNIIANPNCSTMQLLVALKPLYDAVGICRINIATYQAASGAGARAVDELANQSSDLLSGRKAKAEIFSAPLAFNCIPHIDTFQDNGYTREEMKMVWETKKIMEDDSILVNATAVRVPVFYGHGEAVHLETRDKMTATEARELLSQAPGVCVIDEHTNGGYPTQLQHAAGNDEVFVGRIREDISHPHGLNMWIVSDNVRKGAALNAVQIAEILAVQLLSK
ncbi:MAG: aspartate-semialdehyde dehydrogenase [Gammaproteobacteria bacterium WSBS_2016_MAG_OTU1]